MLVSQLLEGSNEKCAWALMVELNCLLFSGDINGRYVWGGLCLEHLSCVCGGMCLMQGEELYTALNTKYCTMIGNKSLFPFSTHTYFPMLALCHNCSLFSSHLFFIISWHFFLYYCCFSNSWQYVQIGLMSIIQTAV